MADLRDDPLAVPGSDPPRIVRPAVNGTTLYAEVRGAGPVILLIPGGAEDAEGWRAPSPSGCRVTRSSPMTVGAPSGVAGRTGPGKARPSTPRMPLPC